MGSKPPSPEACSAEQRRLTLPWSLALSWLLVCGSFAVSALLLRSTLDTAARPRALPPLEAPKRLGALVAFDAEGREVRVSVGSGGPRQYVLFVLHKDNLEAELLGWNEIASHVDATKARFMGYRSDDLTCEAIGRATPASRFPTVKHAPILASVALAQADARRKALVVDAHGVVQAELPYPSNGAAWHRFEQDLSIDSK
jgi:hypothetical protein